MNKKNVFGYIRVLLLVSLTILFLMNAVSCADPIVGTVLDSQIDEDDNSTDDNPNEGNGNASIYVYHDVATV